MQRAAWIFLLMELVAIQSAGAGPESAGASGPVEPAPAAPADSTAQGVSASNPGAALRWWSPENLLPLGDLGVESWADIPRLGTWAGSLDMSMDRNEQRTRAQDNTEFRSAGGLTTEGLTVRNQGFSLVDPRLLTGNAALRFALQQSHQEAGGLQTGQHGRLTGYNLDATLLGEQPYTTSLFANRSQSITTQVSGSSTRTENENRGLIFRWREHSVLRDREILPYFSATVQAREDHTQAVTTLADRVFRLDEQRSLIGIDGHNGSETADLNFRLEETSLENRMYPAGSYEGRIADLAYSRDFGPNRNRRWDSRLDYSSRNGASTMSIFNLDERLTIEHYQNLSTGYNYDFMQQVTDFGTATVQSAGMQLQHRLYNNLTSSLGVSSTQQALPNGNIDSKSGQAWFSYLHAIPWSGQLSAGLGGSLQVTDSQLQSSQIPVINAPYLAPAALGAGASILLNESFVVPGSILVVDVRGGARLPTSEGIDYLVVVEGNRTRILPQPTSLVILPGDPLEVSYFYNLSPSLKFQTKSRSFTLAADWRWIGVSVAHDESLQTPLSEGDSRFLTNRRVDTARVDLRGYWDTVQARGDGTVTRYNYTQLVYDEVRFGQHVTYSPREDLLLSLSANQSHADYQFPQQRQTEGSTVRLDADWVSRSGWLTTAYVSRRVLRDTQMPTDTVTEAAVRLQRRWARLSVSGAFTLAERTRDALQTTAASFHLSAIRDF